MTHPSVVSHKGTRRLAAVAVVAFSGAALVAAPAASAADTIEAAPPSIYQPTVANGEAQANVPLTGVRTSEVWIETPVDTDRDGKKDTIYARIQLPSVAKDGVTVPSVIAASPYYGGIQAVPQHDPYRELWDPSQPKPPAEFGTWNRPGDSDSAGYDANGNYWLSRGFAFLKVAALGTFKSTGCPQMLNDNEAQSMKSVIQWLTGAEGAIARDAQGAEVSAKDWSAGKVGMTGTSYDGALPLITATTGVEGLEAIAPMAPVSNFYEYYHVGGGMYGPDGYQGEDLDNYVLALRPKGDTTCTPTAQEFVEKEDRASGDYNDFWAERNLMDKIDNVHAATLIGHGMDDLNVRVNQSTDWYEALRARGVPTKLYLHQYWHLDLGQIRSAMWTNNLNRWFTHYLFGVDNGVQNEPSARIQKEDKTWIDEASWPAADAGEVTLFPTVGGDAVGGLQSEVRTGAVESKTFADDSTISLQDLAEAAASPNRLVYQTAPLQTELRLSGTATAKLNVAINRPAANISMAIVDHDPVKGTTHIISRAWTDPQNRTDIRTTEAVVPGTAYDLSLGFVPTDYRVPAGHTIGLMVASSDTATSLLPPTSTDLTVDTSATSVTLPVSGAADAVRAALGQTAEPTVAVGAPIVVSGKDQTVTGEGFAPGVDLTLTDGTAGSTPVTVRTGEDGTFSAVLPTSGDAGERTVSVLAGRATIAQATFAVKAPPAIAVSTDKVRPGGAVTVKLSGFDPETEVVVELHSTPVEVGKAQTDADGAAEFVVTIPAGTAVGAHTLVALGPDDVRAETSITVIADTVPPVTGGNGGTGTAGGSGTGGLATTGADVPWIAAGAGALALVAGAVLLWIRRRTTGAEGR